MANRNVIEELWRVYDLAITGAPIYRRGDLEGVSDEPRSLTVAVAALRELRAADGDGDGRITDGVIELTIRNDGPAQGETRDEWAAANSNGEAH